MRIAFWLAGALALHWVLLYPRLAFPHHDFDAVHMYLPMAARLLAEGWAYLGNVESIRVAPASFAWPALLGGELATLKLGNFLLSGLTLLATFRTAWLLHSLTAGFIAAYLFALCPLLRLFLASAVSEGPFLFLVSVWIWALAEYFARGRRAFLALAGAAFGLAILTRGSYFYWLFPLLAYFAWRRERGAFAAHLLALAFPLAFIAKNALLFGFAFFATGSANALYLGSNPLMGGYDPIYVGLLFDTGAITDGAHPLSLLGERRLAAATRILLTETDPAALAALWAQKLPAFLFVTNGTLEGNVPLLRAWRIALMLLSALGLYAARSAMLRTLIAGSLAYQVAVHVPVLYTLRYSVGAMDVWLVLLAAAGLAFLIERRDPKLVLAVAAIGIAGVAAGAWAWRHGGMPEPDVYAVRSELIWEKRAVKGEGTFEIEIRDAPRFNPWLNHVLVVEAAARCDSLRLAYKRDTDADFSPLVTWPLRGDGAAHRYQIGAMRPMNLNAAGRLRIEVRCNLEIARLAVLTPLGAHDLRDRVLGAERAPR